MRPSLRGGCGPCGPRAGCGKAGLGPCWGAAPRRCVGETVQLCRGWEPSDSCRDSRQSAGLPSPSLAAGPQGRAAQALLLLPGLKPRASARSRLRGCRRMGEARASGAVPLSPRRRRLCFSPRRRWPRGPRSRVGGRTPNARMELGRGPARRGAGVKEVDSFYPDQDSTWGLEAEDCQELKPRLDYRE